MLYFTTFYLYRVYGYSSKKKKKKLFVATKKFSRLFIQDSTSCTREKRTYGLFPLFFSSRFFLPLLHIFLFTLSFTYCSILYSHSVQHPFTRSTQIHTYTDIDFYFNFYFIYKKTKKNDCTALCKSTIGVYVIIIALVYYSWHFCFFVLFFFSFSQLIKCNTIMGRH